MSRTPIIPGKWAAKKIASLFCDDAAHYKPTGEAKLVKDSSQEERECCSHPRKLLLADQDEKRFCIVHDPGVGIVSQPSGQWWTFESIAETMRARHEYKYRMNGQKSRSNWWDTIGQSMIAGDLVVPPQPKATSGLTNQVSKRVPTGLQPKVGQH